MLPTTRTQSHSTFILGPLWTCVWRRSNNVGKGCQSVGEKRIVWNWRGCRRQIGRRNWRRVREGGETEAEY